LKEAIAEELDGRLERRVDLFAQLLLVRDYEAIGSLFADTKAISDPAMFEGREISLACLSLIRPSRPSLRANPSWIDNAQ
tara:strand:- start:69 stop:308 length:240 start_codon:yes stop_codon:yes gene_type:complete